METLEYILGAVAVGAVFPVIKLIKDKTVICNYIRPEFLSLVLTVGIAYAIAAIMGVQVPFKELIVVSLAASKLSTLSVATQKMVNGKNKNNHSQIFGGKN